MASEPVPAATTQTGAKRPDVTASKRHGQPAHLLLPMMLQIGFGVTAAKTGMITFVSSVGSLAMRTYAPSILKRLASCLGANGGDGAPAERFREHVGIEDDQVSNSRHSGPEKSGGSRAGSRNGSPPPSSAQACGRCRAPTFRRLRVVHLVIQCGQRHQQCRPLPRRRVPRSTHTQTHQRHPLHIGGEQQRPRLLP